jgi:hypothetical protein
MGGPIRWASSQVTKGELMDSDRLRAAQDSMRATNQKNQEKYPCRTFQQPGHEDRGIEFDKHYSVQQIAEIWGWGVDKVRQIFENEPDVLREGKGDRRSCRRYITLRIPERVVRRVHACLRTKID